MTDTKQRIAIAARQTAYARKIHVTMRAGTSMNQNRMNSQYSVEGV